MVAYAKIAAATLTTATIAAATIIPTVEHKAWTIGIICEQYRTTCIQFQFMLSGACMCSGHVHFVFIGSSIHFICVYYFTQTCTMLLYYNNLILTIAIIMGHISFAFAITFSK